MKNLLENKSETSFERSIFNYNDAIQRIKKAILQSRYAAASLANRELLSLYFSIGEYVSHNTRNKNWSTGAIEIISERLQQELPGLRGFSATNIKNMRLFYEVWKDYIQIRQLPTTEFEPIKKQDFATRQLLTDELVEPKNSNIQIRQLPTAELTQEQIGFFLKVGFTLHREIMRNCKLIVERLFYIEQCATFFWSFEKLKYNLKSNLFAQKGKLQIYIYFINTVC